MRICVLWGSFLDLKHELVCPIPVCINHCPEGAGMDPSPGHHPPHFLYHIQALVTGVWFMWGLSTDVPLPLLFKPKVELKILMETGVTSPQPAPWEATCCEARRIPHLQSRLMVPCLHTHLCHLVRSSSVTSLAFGWKVDLDANGV